MKLLICSPKLLTSSKMNFPVSHTARKIGEPMDACIRRKKIHV